VGSASYDPFGGVLAQQGFTSPWGFAGEYHDPLTGLQYLRARWYQPGVGRFTQVDPFQGIQTLPLTQNPYVYGLNSPTNLTDPTGENPLLWALAAAGIAGGLQASFSLVGYLNRGCSLEAAFNLLLQYDLGRIANVMVSAFVSTLLFSLVPWSTADLLFRVIGGAIIGAEVNVLGSMSGRAVEYWLTGNMPAGSADWKIYWADVKTGALFGIIGQLASIAIEEYLFKAVGSTWLNQNAYNPGNFATASAYKINSIETTSSYNYNDFKLPTGVNSVGGYSVRPTHFLRERLLPLNRPFNNNVGKAAYAAWLYNGARLAADQATSKANTANIFNNLLNNSTAIMLLYSKFTQ